MVKKRIKMKLDLEKQKVTNIKNSRNISNSNVHLLGSLMLDAYKNTIDNEGESLEDAVWEVQATLDVKYGPFLEKCSLLMEKDGKAISASIVTWFDEVDNPLLAFIMTHPEYKNKGFGKSLLKMSINSLLNEGYKELSNITCTYFEKNGYHRFT